jgi:hypothetical protein
MYFGFSRDDPKLMAAVARLAAEEPFAWTTDTPAQVRLIVRSDISFTVEDDLPPLAGPDGRPQPGINDSLIDRRRWRLAATAAVSTRASIEMHVGKRVWRQEFGHAGSPSDIHDDGPSAAIGSRATFSLDPTYFAAGTTLPANAAELGQDVSQPLGGTLTIVDLRQT